MKISAPSLKFILTGLLLFPCLQALPQRPGLRAMNDTMDLYPGIPLVYDILANDTIPPGDTIWHVTGGAVSNRVTRTFLKDSTWHWTFTFQVLRWGFGGEVTCLYRLRTTNNDTTSAEILFRIHDKSYAYLDINNVRARFNCAAPHFHYENTEFEVPKGSGKTSIFSNSLWIGGRDQQGALHLAAERYRSGPNSSVPGMFPDFYAGPVMDSLSYSIYQDTTWNYVWNLKKSYIEYHRAHYWEPGYVPVHDILTWPGNGNPSLGQAPRLAPFSDRNGDGNYDPFDGDYPEIRGDQALFFIFNDDRGKHKETLGSKLKIEIHGMAYAFDLPDDTAFKNTVFLNYRIFNRSANTYSNTLFGIFTDIDLGCYTDDYIGCDVERNMYYCYNGTPVDGTGQPEAYGAHPPAQGVTLLSGPLMEPDGIDNPRYDIFGNQLCDFSVNGRFFGDSVVDNERYGLQRFTYFNNQNAGVPGPITDPSYAPDYYRTLNGLWTDSTHVVYGGNGNINATGYGPECRFMFPWMSDSTNWGTGCVLPNGPVLWTETTASNSPADKKGVGITGPVTFKPGDMQEIDIAFSWARDYLGTPLSSVEKLLGVADIIKKAFDLNKLPDGNIIYSTGNFMPQADANIHVYPNPASGFLNIRFDGDKPLAGATVELMSGQGNFIKKITLKDRRQTLRVDVSSIPAGFYFARITVNDTVIIKKVVIVH